MDSQTLTASLTDELAALRGELLAVSPPLATAPGSGLHAPSLANLRHYTALRSRDLRPLQRRLVSSGLSSLGRCEQWVLGSVETTLRAARAVEGRTRYDCAEETSGALTMEEGRLRLERNAAALFGGRTGPRDTRIMVSMPEAAADDPTFVSDCIARGADAVRLNAAAGNIDTWLRTIEHVRAAERAFGRSCRVFVDLPGPKLRIRTMWQGPEEVDRVRFGVGETFRVVAGKGSSGAKGTATVAIAPKGILAHAEPGHALWFDDGSVGAVIESVGPDESHARVTFAKPGGQKVRVGKGMNLPDTPIDRGALTEPDKKILRALWGHADAFALSFVRSPEDVRAMIAECDRIAVETGTSVPGIVVKIETRQGFERLPQILRALLACERPGAMLARGDLAVECGFERLADIQEELLCFCEAAHVPVIWATEVLRSLTKIGRPTRAEITDAAVAQRAECVMLNKGDQVGSAVALLSTILLGMQEQQQKKTPMFRPLGIATRASGA